MRTCATCRSFTRRNPESQYGDCKKRIIAHNRIGRMLRMTVNESGFCELHSISITQKIEELWKQFSHKLQHKSTSQD